MRSPIRVLLANDHPLALIGLRTVLAAAPGLQIVGEATDGHTVALKCHELAPDVLLLDLDMPGPRLRKLLPFLRSEYPNVRVLALTEHMEVVYIHNLLVAGVTGYIHRDEVPDLIVEALHAVAQGKPWFSRAASEKQLQRGTDTGDQSRAATLTDLDLVLLQRLVEGKSNQQIGCDLGISDKTVERRLTEVYAKFGVPNRVRAAVLAICLDLVEAYPRKHEG